MCTIRWLADRTSGLFYGSAFVEVADVAAARALVRAAAPQAEAETRESGSAADAAPSPDGPCGVLLRGRRLRVHYAPLREGERGAWPPPTAEEHERPPPPPPAAAPLRS